MNGPTMIDSDFRYILNRAVDESAARQIHALLAQRLKQFRREVLAQLATTLSKPTRCRFQKTTPDNPARTEGGRR